MKVRVHSEDHKLLKLLADTANISIADVVRMIINGHITKKQINTTKKQIANQELIARQEKIDLLNQELMEDQSIVNKECKEIEEYMDREIRKSKLKIVK